MQYGFFSGTPNANFISNADLRHLTLRITHDPGMPGGVVTPVDTPLVVVKMMMFRITKCYYW